jgi:ABC-2 type transport system ATP-binding protein
MSPGVAADHAIELSGLRKVYPGRTETVAVDHLDLQVRRGEVFGLLGPNGAGKTTTVEICEGLTRQTAGSVSVLGRRWGEPGADQAIRERIGVCLQETRFFEKQSVRETLQLFRAAFGPARGDGLATGEGRRAAEGTQRWSAAAPGGGDGLAG